MTNPVELILVVVLNFAGTNVEAQHVYGSYPNMGMCQSVRASGAQELKDFAKAKIQHWEKMGYIVQYHANYGACVDRSTK